MKAYEECVARCAPGEKGKPRQLSYGCPEEQEIVRKREEAFGDAVRAAMMNEGNGDMLADSSRAASEMREMNGDMRSMGEIKELDERF